MRLEELTLEPLGDHDRAAFSCGKPPLDAYLKTQASQDKKRNLARTYVLVQPDQPKTIIGYYSLWALSLDISLLPSENAKGIPYPAVPCLLIGRLALDQRFQGQGLGGFLLDRALRHCLDLSQQMGVFAVVVDALDEQAKRFYLASGFHLLGEGNRLFVPIKEIVRAV